MHYYIYRLSDKMLSIMILTYAVISFENEIIYDIIEARLYKYLQTGSN